MVEPHLTVAVAGAGHLGTFHARALQRVAPGCLRAVVDCLPERAERLAGDLGVRAAADVGAVLGEVDALIVATPTATHYAVARAALAAGCHVLVEKPITATLEEGRELVALAAAKRRVLQVGHIERFNPIFRALQGEIGVPAFVEAERLAPFVPRSLDVDVVLDLMVHDLDLLLSLVPAEATAIEAVGVAVLSPGEDIAAARLRFANGTVAHLTASRVSQEKSRKIRFFSRRGYHSLDLLARSARKVRIAPDPEGALEVPGTGRFAVAEERLERPEPDPLGEELRSFLAAAAAGGPPVVDGEAALRVLALAGEIRRRAQAGLREFRETPPWPTPAS